MKRSKILALALALALVATFSGTFAWFTDSVESQQNTIQTGNLDIDLEYSTDMTNWQTVQDASDLFNPDARWEPGYTEYVYLRLINKGDLAVKYELGVNYEDEVIGTSVLGNEITLSEYLAFDVVDVTAPFANRAEARAAAANAQRLNDYTFMGSMTEQGETKTMAMVVFMPEDVGNEANYRGDEVPEVQLGIRVQATQLAYESDAFDNTYDADANPPSGSVLEKEENQELVIPGDQIEITIPADAPAGTYTLRMSGISYDVQNRLVELSTDLELYYNGELVDDEDGIVYEVNIKTNPFLDIKSLTCGGKEITNYVYEEYIDSGISFTANNTGEIVLKYDPLTEGLRMDANGKITRGFFVGFDPSDYDATLKDADSEYIIVTYAEDGKDYYYVGHHDAVKIVTENGVYEDWKYTYNNIDGVVVKDDGKLWSIVDGLKNKDYSYVLLAPGEYTEATTVNVYSSMTIAGLGAAEDVNLIKGTSSDSNRHLINASGTKADYIEVVIRNLSLEAKDQTTGKKDNAAVQSIRKSKVKCYNLNITKGTGWDAVALYVNGNNAVDGVKYPAYLYAEDVTLNTTRTFGVVTTSGSYKFFHDGLTYNDGNTAYTNNSGSIKNSFMVFDDWTWD